MLLFSCVYPVACATVCSTLSPLLFWDASVRRLGQVLFSDDTEILLSKGRRLVTFVDGDGKRETHPRQWAESR